MQLKKHLFACSAILLSVILPLMSCGEGNHIYTCTLNEISGVVDFHTEAQKKYISGNYDAIECKGDEELSRPQGLRLEWSLSDEKSSKGKAQEYLVELSRSEDFATALSFHTEESYVDVYNLYLGATYYWRVSAKFANGGECLSTSSSFKTAEGTPRNLYIDGVTNARDLGGWEIEGGRKVKQGMLYRTARLNRSYAKKPKNEISEKGKKTMLDELGVRSEIDLRNPNMEYPETGGLTSSVLGEDVNYYNVPMSFSDVGEYVSTPNEQIKEIFSILSKKNNYPVFFHCNIGTDRTGLIAFLVNGLLGVSEEDLYRDYLFSNFANIGGSRTVENIREAYVDRIKAYQGESLSEKIRNCLLGCGVSADQLDDVVSIMSE